MTILYIGRKWLCVNFGNKKIYRNKEAREMVAIFINNPLSVEWAKWITVKNYY